MFKSSIQWSWKNVHFSSPRTINSFKTTLACLIGYGIYLWVPLLQAQWIIITILVVMSAQSSVGGMLIKSQMRFWGTTAGAIISAGALILCDHSPLCLMSVLLVSALFFAYVAGAAGDISAAGTLGAVTVAMILLSPTPTLAIAVARFVEISLGIVIAFMVSRFIVPIHAHTLLLRSFSSTLQQLRDHFDRCLQHDTEHFDPHVNDADEKIVAAFALQRKLIHEVEAEPGHYKELKKVYQQILEMLIKIYRATNLMHYSAYASLESMRSVADLRGLDKFKHEVSWFLFQLAEVLKTGSSQQSDFIFAELIDYMEHEFKKIVHQKEYEQIASVNTFIFGARLLMQRLKILTEAIDKINVFRRRSGN